MRDFCVGDVIASSMDPNDPNGFFCGTIKEIDGENYVLHFYDDVKVSISRKNAVSLRSVLERHCDDKRIIADKAFLANGETPIFVGGLVVSNRYGANARYCVRMPSGGKWCLVPENCVPATEALRIIEPCPRR
jgi:hypothetical protein